ncbi:MAG: hypothetical protein ABIW47_15600 [Ginsengibacter sp.]
MYIKSLSQEHGTITLPEKKMDQYIIGDILYILPVHSCMTANAMKKYRTVEGKWIGRL